MPSLEKSLRNQLERTVKDARDVAEAGARATLEQLGVGDAGPPSHLSEPERELRRRLRIHGRQLGDELIPESTAQPAGSAKRNQQIDRLVEEVAYEHWHRLLFASFLAENGLLMYPDPQEPVAVTIAECDDLAVDEKARNGWELAAKFAAKMLPEIFRVDSPVFELQLPPEHQQRLEKLVAGLSSEVYAASDSLGWVYQFWQARRKEKVNESGVKIGARELPAVTQLFTEDYMVDFLLDNTLGAWWAGKQVGSFQFSVFSTEEEVRRAVALPGCEWNYLRFIREPTALAAGSSDSESIREKPEASAYGSQWRPAAGTFDGWPKSAKGLKCLDPCMGSGHFVVAMFERLVALRIAEEGIDEREAVAAVIRENLYGLEIDPRCTQIAAFNLALAAWRRVGYCVLPPMNLACSGLAPNTSKEEWLTLAGDSEKLQGGMERLYELLEQAPVLGSLINPRASEGDLLVAAFHELQPLLEKALAQESKDDTAHEMAVTARGLAKAAEILDGQFTLVATNVPYLGRGKQDDVLQDYCEYLYYEAKNDLATCFVERCSEFCILGGSTALVTPQNWLFLGSYKNLREKLLREVTWNSVTRLGPKAFQTPMWDFNICLVSMTSQVPIHDWQIAGLDVADKKSSEEKSSVLLTNDLVRVSQANQLNNPDARIVLAAIVHAGRIGDHAETGKGICTFDSPRFYYQFWELRNITKDWLFSQGTIRVGVLFDGRSVVLRWEDGKGQLAELMSRLKDGGYSSGAWRAGEQLWGNLGILVGLMGDLRSTVYDGYGFDNNTAAIVPNHECDLLPLFAFCTSPEFTAAARVLDQKMNVTSATLEKIPFDLAHWQKVAAEKYPDGLPKPFSSDPTQWLFDGHPAGADQPLQVAVARLLGYQWPRQTGSNFSDCPALGPDGLESHADKDGIVCIPPVRGEASASDRLLNLLAAAYGSEWSGDVLGQLLNDAGYAGKGLETWLRDGFFTQHLDLFHKRPFIWHIWDGLRDGFSALVNYHKLDRKNLETLIYTYLGDWITRQTHDAASGIDGAQERLAAAEQLKKRLELILEGEAPYDIFVRWKPLHQQPIGWEPDINDGVRMNIRPFVSVPDVKVKGAGILRVNPKIKWEKDRGKEPARDKEAYPWFWSWDGKTTDFTGAPDFTGDRYNDCHHTLAMKRSAHDKKA